MNNFKLLPCGRIIFYNSRIKRPAESAEYPLSVEESGAFSDSPGDDDKREKSAVPLGLSDVAISDKNLKRSNRAKRGSKGITSHGRALIRSGCYWLEDKHGRKNLTFLTVTLPDEAMLLCTPESWSVVINRYLKGIRYHLEQKGLCTEIVGCIEVQGDRLKNTNGIPPLHLHLLFQGRQNYKHWGLGKKFYQRLWEQTCRTVWNIEAEFGQSCRVESIRKSGVAYMSKYLSKGGDVLSRCNPNLLPTAWYTLTSELKEIIKQTTLHGDSYLAEHLYTYLWNGELLSWSHQLYSPEHGNGSRYLIAWVGQIQTRGKYWEIKDTLEHLIYRNTEISKKSYEFDF